MTSRLTLLAVHVALILLASTCFTVVTGLGHGRFQWEYFRYFLQTGWGRPYEFYYSLPVVATYLAAYAAGATVYGLMWRTGSSVVGPAGVLLCVCGMASFAYELTHWISPHYGSWIASAPGALLVLALVAAYRQYRCSKHLAHLTDRAAPGTSRRN